ncbi:hypothetical protein [Zoogloea sp.]|uniref:hypothetical protein n=1 Tax=Zoogloea sp. TaxID=49181 RepID=UPI002603761A|nr:hypothetical protein [Zoogloea sp.]
MNSNQTPRPALAVAAVSLETLLVAHEGIHHAFFMGGDMQEAAWHTAALLRTAQALRDAIGPGLVDLSLVEQLAEDAYATYDRPRTVLTPAGIQTRPLEGGGHEA